MTLCTCEKYALAVPWQCACSAQAAVAESHQLLYILKPQKYIRIAHAFHMHDDDSCNIVHSDAVQRFSPSHMQACAN